MPTTKTKAVPRTINQWPFRLLPLHVAAAAAAGFPNFVLDRGLLMAALAVLIAGERRKLGLPDALAAALALWATACAVDSGAEHGLRSAGYYWSAAALFIACRVAITNRRRLLSIIACYVGGCLYVVWKVVNQTPGEVTDFRPEIDGLNINLAAYGLVTGAACIVAVLSITHVTGKAKAALFAVVAALAYGTSGTDTRAAIGALLMAVTYLLVRRLSAGSGFKGVAIAVPVILLTAAFGLVDLSDTSWLEAPFRRQTGDLSGRLEVWPYARALWSEHPIAGLGPRVFQVVNPMQIGAHNLVLTVGVEIGAVGLVLYAAVVASALSGFRHNQRIRHLGALILLAWLPIWLTGHWELSPAAWIALALWSTLPDLQKAQPDCTDSTSHLVSAEFQSART